MPGRSSPQPGAPQEQCDREEAARKEVDVSAMQRGAPGQAGQGEGEGKGEGEGEGAKGPETSLMRFMREAREQR